MGQVAYTLADAATATGATLAMVKDAVRKKQLRARDAEGNCVVLHIDLIEWVESFPNWDR